MRFTEIFPLTTYEEEKYVFLYQLQEYLNSHKDDNDKKKDPYHDVVRCMRGYGKARLKESSEEICGIQVKRVLVPVTYVLKYVYQNTSNLKSCAELAETVSKEIGEAGRKKTSVPFEGEEKNISQLYDLVKLVTFLNPRVYELYEIKASDVPSLTSSSLEYINRFSPQEQQNILLFEYHYFKCNGNSCDGTYEESLAEKWKFFEQCKKAKALAGHLQNLTNSTIKDREERKRVGSIQNGIKLHCHHEHLYNVLESDIKEDILAIFPHVQGNDIAITCAESSTSVKDNSVHVFIQTKSDEIIQSMPEVISKKIYRKHKISKAHIVFLKYGTSTYYKQKSGCVSRYSLMHDFMGNKLRDRIIDIVPNLVPKQCDNLQCDEATACNHSFNEIDKKPLTYRNFDMFEEWLFGVPLEMQIVLCSFLNSNSVAATKDTQKYIQTKLERLYTIYDMLLNVTNSKHMGLFQEANTYELILGYKSAETTFSITNRSGTSFSLPKAENELTLMAGEDECYYRSFMKPHDFIYFTIDGAIKRELRMFDCFVIILIDNLVRLKTREDPEPGVCRSKQLDLLPITLQGLPKDSNVTSNWHDLELCDGTPSCRCKSDIDLNKDDIQRVLFEKTEEEQKVADTFKSLMSWAVMSHWKDIKETHTWKALSQSKQIAATVREQHPQMGETSEASTTDVIPDVNEVVKTSEHAYTTDDFIKRKIPLSDIENSEAESDSDWMSDSSDHTGLTTSPIPNETCRDSQDSKHDDIVDDSVYKLLENVTFAHLEELPLDELMKELGCNPIEDVPSLTAAHTDKQDIDELEKSFNMINLCEQSNISEERLPIQFGLHKFDTPKLLATHPPPYTGRDDDIAVLQKVLDDTLIKLGCYQNDPCADKILIGPDHKIGSNLVKLMRRNPKYLIFLLEFPLLHFRKSLINTTFGTYKDAGLLEMMQYTIDSENKEWSKLVSSSHIDTATEYVRRLSLGIHLAIFFSFFEALPFDKSKELEADLDNLSPYELSLKWKDELMTFSNKASEKNINFNLHLDLVYQLDRIVALSLAERLGGEDGYKLLLSVAKESVPTGFLNGALAYAPYTVELLHQHHRAGPFYQNLKTCLYSTSLKDGNANFSTDTKRELEHVDAIKGFRSGSTVQSVSKRLSVIDVLQEVMEMRKPHGSAEKLDSLGWNISSNDMGHVLRAANVVFRRGGVSSEENSNLSNVYAAKKNALSEGLLNKNSKAVGEFMVMRYLAKEGLFHCTQSDVPKSSSLTGPKDLVLKAKTCKGVTMKRSSKKSLMIIKDSRELKEEKRKQILKRKTKKMEGLTSEMNNCQCFVNADCSKRSLNKAAGISVAIFELLMKCLRKEDTRYEEKIHKSVLKDAGLVWLGEQSIPYEIAQHAKFASIEFAGFKYKSHQSGKEYLDNATKTIKSVLSQAPNVKRIVVCEEKYRFTPNIFKAATREKRSSKVQTSIAHLRNPDEILTSTKFCKDAITSTEEGKKIAGKYLADNATKLEIKNDVVIDFDSEHSVLGCMCDDPDIDCHSCPVYALPIRCTYTSVGNNTLTYLDNVCQRKGEAEMSQLDWIVDTQSSDGDEGDGDALLSFVTSADIDSVVVHLFVLAKYWRRDEHGKLKNRVYVILQKQGGKVDVYNMSAILELLEEFSHDDQIGCKVAVSLCLGGNDFVPKMTGIVHSKIVKLVFSNTELQNEMFNSSYGLEKEGYMKLMKLLFSKGKTSHSFEQVRLSTIVNTRATSSANLNDRLKDPSGWLPPRSVLERVLKLINLQVEYLHIAGQHGANLPNFLEKGSYSVKADGKVEYDFGPESLIKESDLEDLVKRAAKKTPKKTHKRKSLENSPRHGRGRKKLALATVVTDTLQSTPKSGK